MNSKKIYVVDKGQILGEGSHEEPLKKSNIYVNFYNKQIIK